MYVQLEKYSIGVGDRFGRQGGAQLKAVKMAGLKGVEVTPVWNKSHREHTIVGTSPADTRKEADKAAEQGAWEGAYFVDADQINLQNVDSFIEVSDFFTIDVANFIGRTAYEKDMDTFIKSQSQFLGNVSIPGIESPLQITQKVLKTSAEKYYLAIQKAGEIYRYIASKKGEDNFVTEVSMDECELPQTPIELFLILSALSGENIPVQTIAPKFTGKFHKGVDYLGKVDQFIKEFREDVAVTQFAVKEFALPPGLKLSIHSGSDKFSLYQPVHQILKDTGAGVHIKTAGTTWLEELLGLALCGGEGLAMAKKIYSHAYRRFDEMCGPYANVVDINKRTLPEPGMVDTWDEQSFASVLRHDQACDKYNNQFRQLLHVAYKVAAEMGTKYLNLLEEHQEAVGVQVTNNLYDRHIGPLFLGV